MNKIARGDYPPQSEINPGEKLKGFLENLYPMKAGGFISSIDADFMCDGEFDDLYYKSSINYLIRRLITTGHYIRKSYLQQGDIKVRAKLREYLADYTRLEGDQIARLLSLLMECMETSEDDFNSSEKSFLRKQIEEFEWGCYICGKAMDTGKNSTLPKAATADHNWPKFMGGLSVIGNLRYACQECNSKYKKDFIDYSDYHYEEIAFIILNYAEYIQKIQRNGSYRGYETAVFAKTNYSCSVCRQPAHRVGELYIGRIDPQDSWHYLNLTAYCPEHKFE